MVDHVVLVGMMGAGKTAVGRRLADRLGRPFVDSDEQVQAATGRTVRDIWESDGEAPFRRLEAEALRAALADRTPAVVAAAGGTVLDADNRRAIIQSGPVVWLRARPATLARRVGGDDHRPLLGPEPLDTLERLDHERAGLYAEVADHTVDVDDLTLAQVETRVMERVA